MPAQQLDQMRQAAAFHRLEEVGLKRIAHQLLLARIETARKQREPFTQELAVCRGVLELERVEP